MAQQEMEKQMYQQQMAERQRQATIEAQRMAEYKRQQDMEALRQRQAQSALEDGQRRMQTGALDTAHLQPITRRRAAEAGADAAAAGAAHAGATAHRRAHIRRPSIPRAVRAATDTAASVCPARGEWIPAGAGAATHPGLHAVLPTPAARPAAVRPSPVVPGAAAAAAAATAWVPEPAATRAAVPAGPARLRAAAAAVPAAICAQAAEHHKHLTATQGMQPLQPMQPTHAPPGQAPLAFQHGQPRPQAPAEAERIKL